ncbi:lectin like domain-containing protein, partial [Synergistaceae bacterium OttesenSCG-928-I11]|nr:lectin like domain-containing protein [Synergistaceae bacterium OttesenSCG-928-I11]
MKKISCQARLLPVFALFFLFAAIAPVEASYQLAPPSKEFEEFSERIRVAGADSDAYAGYVPFLMDRSHVTSADYAEFLAHGAARAALPSRYDLREWNAVTPAKQQRYGDCWAYSALGSVESIYKRSKGTELDLSEMHLAWFAINSEPSFNTTLDIGALDNVAVALLSRWVGPVLQSDLPNETSNPSGKYSDYKNRLHLEHAYFLALEFVSGYDKSSMAVRKQLLVDHGGLSIGINSNAMNSPIYYNAATNAGYNDTNTHVNHAVLLCGWDDNFSRENFNEGRRPKANGAWLVKNSYGTSVGDNGFFWISYEDISLCDGVAYIAGEANNYDKNYGHDELGWSWSIGEGSETGWMANVFRSGSLAETLKAVSFYTTGNNAEYEVRVYTGLTDSSKPNSGTLASTKRGTQTFAGYHTVVLDTPVEMAAKTDFAVVVRVRTPGYSYPIPVEMPVPGVSYYRNATAKRGESFLSSDGSTWKNATAPYD